MKKLIIGLLALVMCFSSFKSFSNSLIVKSVQVKNFSYVANKSLELQNDEDFIQLCKNYREIAKTIREDVTTNENNSKISTEEFSSKINAAAASQDKESILNAYKEFGITSGEKIWELLEQQATILQNLVAKYPELKTLSQIELKSLLLEKYNLVAINLDPQPTSEATNGNCEKQYGEDKADCDHRSDKDMVIGGVVTFLSCFTGPLGGAIAYGAMVASTINNYTNCMADASKAYRRCLGN